MCWEWECSCATAGLWLIGGLGLVRFWCLLGSKKMLNNAVVLQRLIVLIVLKIKVSSDQRWKWTQKCVCFHIGLKWLKHLKVNSDQRWKWTQKRICFHLGPKGLKHLKINSDQRWKWAQKRIHFHWSLKWPKRLKVNSDHRWKRTRFRVRFHLWSELTFGAMNEVYEERNLYNRASWHHSIVCCLFGDKQTSKLHETWVPCITTSS